MNRIRTIDGVELYDLIRARDNVALAVKNACKDHAKDPFVIHIKEDPEPYIDAVCEILDNEAFHYSEFLSKVIFERGKWRHLCYTRTFPDRIVQHAVMQIVAPILLGTCTADTYAAIPGRGLHKANQAIRAALKNDPNHTRYCLKIDVKSYFPSVDREILWELIKRKIRCSRTLKILHTMIFDCPGEGLLIGLYISQILSSFYLSTFDHYVKEVLGQPYYFRHMDDVVVLSGNKDVLRWCLFYMTRELNKLGLTVKGNWQIFPVDSRGIDFIGYVFRHTHTRVRKRNKIAYKRSCSRIVWAVAHKRQITPHMLMSKQSYEGMMGWCDARNLVKINDGRVFRAIEFGVEAV